MKKIALSVAVVSSLLLSGCTHTALLESDTSGESSLSYQGKVIHASVSNTIESGFLSSSVINEVTFYIDGNKIIEAPMRDDFSGNFSAIYGDDSFSFKCKKPAFYKTVECIVHANNKILGTLNFEYVI